MAQIIDTIIQSETPPKKTNVLWDNGTSVMRFREGEWQPIGGEYDKILEQINNNIYYLDKNKADKTEIPKKLSELEQDIEIRYDDAEIREELLRLETDKADKSELTELSERIDNLPSGESSVFKAIYGETTYEEIKAAYDSGRVVHCDYNTYCYVLSRFTENGAYFNAVNGSNSYRMDLTTGDTWTSPRIIQIEEKNNKVTSLSSSSTDTQYPSAKAVYDFVGKQGIIRQTQTWTRAADKGYDYVMSNLVRGAIPQANIDLFTSAGAIFNAESGYFELNGLTDISYEEMVKIYAVTNPLVGRMTLTASLINADVRTNLPIFTSTVDAFGNGISSIMDLGAMAQNSNIECLCIYGDNVNDNSNISNWLRITSIIYIVRSAKYLRKVKGCLSLNLSSTSYAFSEAFSLEEIYLKKIKSDISFKDSSRLSYDSVKYMIGKSTPSSAITFTLHTTALANAEAAYLADAEQDLATYPTLSDWALSKNIQIATA